MLATAAHAQVEGVPAKAKRLSGPEIAKWLDGKSLSVKIFDAGVPVVGTTNWDLAGKRVWGTFDANGQSGTFDNEWVIKGDTSCAEKAPDGSWICQRIFVVGKTMYEVTADGTLHAISKVK